MTAARKSTLRKNNILSDVKPFVLARRDFEESLAGASRTERGFFSRAITLMDRVISLQVQLHAASDDIRTLAAWKPHPRRTARASRR
jgi:hypothetical protein